MLPQKKQTYSSFIEAVDGQDGERDEGPCWNQAVIWSFFLGKRRGEFEYTYHEKVATDARKHPKLHRLCKDAKEELRLGDPASMGF